MNLRVRRSSGRQPEVIGAYGAPVDIDDQKPAEVWRGLPVRRVLIPR
jgi:ABC-type microcin C transport system permease subunit YejE